METRKKSTLTNNVFGPGGASGVTPLVIAKSAIPFIKLSSGTMGNNGALSAITALPRTFSGGAYVWLPAGAIAAGVPASASWYWCVFSSATAGTVYNSTYTSGQPVVGTTTAFSTTGPGAFTGDTGTVTSVSISIPGGALGVNGVCLIDFGVSINNTVGNKSTSVKFGAAQCFNNTLTTQQSYVGTAFARNRGILTAQEVGFLYGLQSSAANGTVQATDGAENTNNAVTVTITLNSAVATDHNILEHFAVTLLT